MKPPSLSLSKVLSLAVTVFVIIVGLSTLSVDALVSRPVVFGRCLGSNLKVISHVNLHHRYNHIGRQVRDRDQNSQNRRHCGNSVELQMGFNLPPSGNNKNDGWKDDFLIPGATVAGLALFFMSPLGGIFFAVTNTLFVLALLTPFILFFGFQGWQFFFTAEAPCPNCSAPVRTMKDDQGQPTICLSCGNLVRKVNGDGDDLELCGPPPGDSFFQTGENNNGASIFEDIFGGSASKSYDDVDQKQSSSNDEKQNKFKREQTIIDVEVERDD